VKNALAMKIMDCLGAGRFGLPSITRWTSTTIWFDGHDGPGHIAIAEGKQGAPLTVYHGKVGRGLSVEMSVKHGPVTLLSVVEDEQSRFKLVVAKVSACRDRFSRLGIPTAGIDFRRARGVCECVECGGAGAPLRGGRGACAGTLEKVRR